MDKVQEPPWRSVRDDPPRGQWQVAYVAEPDQISVYAIKMIKGRLWIYDWGIDAAPLSAATHWMPLADWPLPPAPEGDA